MISNLGSDRKFEWQMELIFTNKVKVYQLRHFLQKNKSVLHVS
jgi:hypothetical protein